MRGCDDAWKPPSGRNVERPQLVHVEILECLPTGTGRSCCKGVVAIRPALTMSERAHGRALRRKSNDDMVPWGSGGLIVRVDRVSWTVRVDRVSDPAVDLWE